MEKEVTINSLFGETIYYTNIVNDDQDTAKHIESFVKEKPGRTAATTDVKGNMMFNNLEEAKDNLHKDKKYSNLFKEIATTINDFLKAKGYSKEKFDAHITKSWATYTEKNKYIATHEHVASQFSFVYYVQINEEHSPLTFYEQKQRFYMPDSSEWNDDNFKSMSYGCTPGLLIVFPSHVYHGTEKVNMTDVPRISISGDIVITAQPGVVTESLMPHPSTWRSI